MNTLFETAGGSVIGTAHLQTGRNGQDGLVIAQRGDATVMIVTDGCGSARESEVGARLGARIVASVILARSVAGPEALDWKEAAVEITARLARIAHATEDPSRTIAEQFLFTVVGVLITPWETTVFSAGDGLFVMNGAVHLLGPFENNAPPYLAYGALSGGAVPEPELSIHLRARTEDIRSVLIATDGAERLPAGDLQTLAEDDPIFRNPDALRRKLFLLTRRGTAVLDDDTTIAVARRRPATVSP